MTADPSPERRSSAASADVAGPVPARTLGDHPGVLPADPLATDPVSSEPYDAPTALAEDRAGSDGSGSGSGSGSGPGGPGGGSGHGPGGRGPGGDAANRKVGRAALWSGLSNLTLPLTSLASGPILAHTLGPEQRGQMAAAIAPVFVLMFVANLGLPEATTYGIAALKQNPRKVFWGVARVSMIAGVLAGASLWYFAPWVIHDPATVPVLREVVFFLPLLMLVIILRFAVSGMREFRAVNIERVLTPLLRLSAFVVLLLLGTLDVHTAAVSQVAATVIGGCFLFLTMRRHRTAPEDLAPPRPHLTRELTGYGVRGWGAVFGNLVNWRLDQLVLGAVAEGRQLGYYVVAVHFAELPSTAVNAVRNVLFAESAHRDNVSMIARAARVVVFLTTCGAIVAALSAYWLIKFVFGAAFTPATTMAQVLLIATIPFSVEQVLAAGLLAKGKPGRRSVGQVIAAVVTVVGLFTLTPILGAMGAALTSLVAYSVNASIAVWQFRRLSHLSVSQILVPRPADVVWFVTKILGRRKGRPRAGAAAAVAVPAVADAVTTVAEPVTAVEVPTSSHAVRHAKVRKPLARHQTGTMSPFEGTELRSSGRHRAEGRPSWRRPR